MKFIKMFVIILYFGVVLTHAVLAAQEEYDITVQDYTDIEKNLTISNILSYSDVTNAYGASPWGLDWGEIRAPYKWNVTTANGEFSIGFERYETISTYPLAITFFRTVTEQRGTHKETRYREAIPVQKAGIIQKAGIMGISAGSQETGWWNSAWQYRIDNPIPDGARPYQLSLTLSNSAGTNNANHIFLNGHAKSDFSDIRFTLNNAIELSYWIESAATGKVWVKVPDNGTVNIYYGNPSASDISDGKSTFEFFDDFATLDLGANPVISPSQSWENVGYLRWGSIAYLNGIYYMYYTNGASTTSDIGRASSTDLITWTKNANNPVILDSIGPSLLKELDGKTPVFVDGKYWMLTMKSDGSAIELRSSPTIDSNTWTLENASLIQKGGTWHANYLYTTSFVKENDSYYIVMESGSPGGLWKIGYFKASTPIGPYIDSGVLLSPTLPWEGIGVLDPEMRKFGNTYYLFYTGNEVFPYQNSYAYNPLSLGSTYQKSNIIVTPGGQSYPAILQKDSYYYILADDQPTKYTGKSLFRRKDLNGPFGSPFDWNRGGTPTLSGSELLINANGEFLRSSSNFLYKAMKIRAKYAPTSAVNSFQYFGFVPSSAANEYPSEMYFGSEGDLNTFSGNSTDAKNTSIYSPDFFGSYHNYEILWRKGEAKFIIDDILKTTHTTSVADASLPLGIYDYNTAANLTVDWIFVRNYVFPEPEWAGWSTQTSQTGVLSITGLPQESQVSDIAGAIRTFNITANQAVNVTWYLNSVIVKDTEKSVTLATYTNSASMGVWNLSAVAKNANGNIMQTWTWTVSNTTTSPGISFIDPTPANGATLNQNYVYIDTTVLDFNTAFIDWNRSLAGWWRFNSESGENTAFFRDWSSMGNNGTCSGTSCPISTSGKFGNSLGFDGSNDYITVPDSATLNPTYVTVETWFNAVPGSLSNQKSLVQKPYTSHANPYYQYMLSLIDRTTSPKQVTFYITVNGVLHEVDGTNLNYGYGQWHYLAGTYDGSIIALYLDGALVATKAVSGTMNSYNTVIQFGSYPNLGKTSNYVFNGKIDEVRIHNRALNLEEIKASYNTGIYRLYRNYTNLPYGTYAYTAYAQNLAGYVNQTETRTVAVTSFLPDVPLITVFAPLSPLTNAVGDSRTFNITINNPVNLTWYLNGVVIKNNEKGVTQASYSNTSASQGTWIINATATNTNGTVSKEWIWNVGQNAAFYQTIFNTDGSITFKNKNNGNIILTSAPQYFLNYCQGTNCFEITNGNINPTVVTEGNLTYITAIDDTNSYAKVTHNYELDAASPYIKYTATLRYKQNVTVTGERFVFNVPDKDAQVMTRDMKIIPFDNLKTYWSDLYTPKVIKFNNGLYFVGSDTMESMKLQTSGTGSLVSFYSDYNENHPHFHYVRNGAGQITYTSESIRSINDAYSASITFAINPSVSPKTLIKTRQPYGYDAALTLTNHADNEMLTRIAAVAYGTEDEKAPDYGTKGIAGRGIGWTKSVFISGCSPPVGTDDCYQGADLQDINFKAQTDKLYNDGVEIVGHTTMPEIESTSMVSAGVQTLSQYNTRNWIDHGASGGISNWEDLASQGAIKGDSNYVLDIFDQYNYKYAWSYIDLPTTSYGPNMLEPAKTEEVRPFFFYNNQVDNNVYDSKRIYLWSTINTKQVPDLYYTNSNIDSLISERGMHIGHEYMAIDTINNHAWYISGGITKIYPAFDSELANIASKKENGLLWSPTMSTLGDYLVSLKDITVMYNSDGTYNITNFGSSSITGITLLAEDTIQSATIDERSLVSFGGSYGNNEMILPPLAVGQSFNLKIIYGAKDTSIPTITSNDAGKTRVNEITGIWDNKTKQLTMTAKGTSVTRSFTVRIPNLANKIITVEDTTSGTTIGSYAASGNGDITFLAPLGSLHTFRIGEFEESATGPAITSFAPISPTVNDYTGSTRSFNFTVNQTVNVSWYLNGVVIKNSEKGIQQASYINTSASIGTWNVSAIASNSKGTLMKTWTWNVMSQSPSDVKSITISPSEVSVIRRGSMQLDIPTYDGSGQAVHPDVYYNANGWRGYKYWMVMTPYPNGNDAYENPSILVSNDGISWSVPQGLQNPVDPKPASGSNSDVDIVYNETADRIEIYYVESGAGTSYLIRRTSTDGITWSAEKNNLIVPDYQVMSPAIIKNGSVYDMWYTGGASCSADTTVKFANSADGLNWSSPQMVNMKTDLNIWHLDVSYIPSQNEYWMVYAAYPKGSTCGNTDLYFAKSKDKINWTNYPDIIIKRGASWDSSQIYRSTFLFNDTSNTMRICYSARGGVAWHIGYVEKQYFSAKAKDQSGQTVNVSIMWASSDVSVGTITSGGLFSALSPGMTTITASNGTVSTTANVQVTDTSLPVQPSITSYLPASPLSDIEGATRTFRVTVNQRVNVTWFINSNQVQFNGSVSSATYTNTSAIHGIWSVSAVVSNTNGSAIQTWTWDISSTNAAQGIFFTDPTPENGAILNQNHAYINTTVLNFATAFIDWNNSLAGWWRLNSESGENAAFFRDWSSKGNNGTCSGTSCPVSNPGKFGNALGFDGSNDYITIPNSASLNPSYITVETWFNAAPGSLSYQKSLVQKPYTSHANPYYQYMISLIDKTTNPKQATFYITINGVLHEVYATNLNYGYGQWHYLAGTYDGSNIVLYLDGALVATKAVSGTMNSYNTVLQFGSYPNLGKTSNYIFNGKIDEVRIHNRALSLEEIKASYNTGIYRLYRNFTNLPYGGYAYTAYVQNLAGDVNQTETRMVSLTLTPVSPSITAFDPATVQVNDIADQSRTFNISLNQAMNVTWYLNSAIVKDTEKSVTKATYTNTSASMGVWNVSAVAKNANGNIMQTWTWNITSAPVSPSITAFDPATVQVNDIADQSRTFNISLNQAMNVTWYLNSAIVKDTEKSVTKATYTNTSASMGVWNVSAVAKNANGNIIQTWTWTVSSTTPPSPGISFIDPTPANGATLNQNYVYINTTVLNFATAFIDWNNSLAGWWRLNGESGENTAFFRDWSSKGNNGACSGTSCPVSTPGKFGNALGFDGSNDYITIPNSASLNPSYVTVETWFNAAPGSLSYQKSLVQKPYTSHVNPYYQYMLSLIDRSTSPKEATFYITINGVLHEVGATNLNYGYGQWHYLAGTYDGSNIELYLDGAGVATKAVSGTMNSYNSVIQFGSYPNLGKTSNYVFNGKIDEVRIHNRALSPEEIKASYNAGIYRLYNNFTNLAGGIYSYRAYAQGLEGNVNQTQNRTLIITN